MEDSELAAASAGGDQEAFASLFVRYRPFVYNVTYKILLNEDDALDVTQDVFMKLARCIGQYSGSGSFKAWLATIAMNSALSHCRKPQRREVATDFEDLREQPAIDAPDALAIAVQRQRREMVARAMEQLSPQQRAIVAMQCSDDSGPSEIARRLELPVSQVRVQLRRAIIRLREIIQTPALENRK